MRGKVLYLFPLVIAFQLPLVVLRSYQHIQTLDTSQLLTRHKTHDSSDHESTRHLMSAFQLVDAADATELAAAKQHCHQVTSTGEDDDGQEGLSFDVDCRLLIQHSAPETLRLLPILSLHPTQVAVGMQQVETKKQLILDKQLLQKPKKMEKFLRKHPLPAVQGPGGGLYIVDHHHLSTAMWQLGIEKAYVEVIEDWQHLSEPEFWQAMAAANYLYLHDAAGKPLQWQEVVEQLPSDVTGLKDDPYRSLAALVRKAGGYQKVWVPFSEFQWANYFRLQLPDAQQDPAHPQVVNAALDLAAKPEAAHLPGHHSRQQSRDGQW